MVGPKFASSKRAIIKGALMRQRIIVMIGLICLLSEVGVENPMPSPQPLEEDEMLARII